MIGDKQAGGSHARKRSLPLMTTQLELFPLENARFFKNLPVIDPGKTLPGDTTVQLSVTKSSTRNKL